MQNGSLTIIEASMVTGKSQTTIYRHIQRGNLQCKKVFCNGKQVLTVQKSDIERIFDINVNAVQNTAKQGDKHCKILQNTAKQEVESLTLEGIKGVIEGLLETKAAQLMKPLESHALFIAGKLSQENQDLKEKLELILNENEELKANIKVLPGPAEEVTKKLQEQENQIKILQQEKEELEAKLKAEAEEQMKQLAEAWKKELEQARRPWWKFW